MQLQKCDPGTENCPYVAGMNVTQIPTMTFTVANTVSNIATMTMIPGPGGSGTVPVVATAPVGTQPYILMMWCPSATAFYGPGGDGYISNDAKLGGLVMMQFSADAFSFHCINRSVLASNQWSHTMFETYGSNMDGFSEGGFVWSAQADVQLLIPKANLVGGMFRGNITYGQLPPKSPDGTFANSLSCQQLMKIAQDAELSDHFHLRSAVVNNDLIFDSQTLGVGNTPSLGDQQFASEVINYVILQTASESITTGNPAEYSMIARLRGNACFWANPFDSMANNLFTDTRSGFNPEPSMSTGLQPDALN